MYANIDFQGLDQIVEVNKDVPDYRFEMRTWIGHSNCGTVACLIGNFCLANKSDNLVLIDRTPTFFENKKKGPKAVAINGISYRFSLPVKISCFLFASRNTTRLKAISRLEKTIKYLKRKQKLWEEYEWEMSLSKKDRRLREKLKYNKVEVFV